jgi:hypothetical protein
LKRFAVILAIGALALPAGASAFHHGQIPARNCAAEAAGSPSNNNGQAREAITAHNPAQTLPLPPVGTPAQDNLGAAPAHENCASV